jgi:hypothetical protein
MALDLGAVKGALELRDSFSEVVVAAAGGMHDFEHQLEHMGGPIAEFAGKFEGSWAKLGIGVGVIATATAAAVAEITHVTMELGERGSTIIEVSEAFEKLAGSTENATNIISSMRSGVKGMVDDFTLTKDATRLLSTGVKLTADDFNLLSKGALDLQQKGFGPAKDMLNDISDAMITGRTRGIALKLGVVDIKDAEADFAAKLGTTADKLSMTGKAEAHRQAVMTLLNEAVTKAGDTQLTFGEKVEQAETKMKNWVDQLAKAVAESPALGIVADTVGQAINDMFGGDQQDTIKSIVGFIDSFLIKLTDVGIVAVEAARVFHTAWSAIEAAVLEAEAVLGTFVQVLGHSIEGILNLATTIPGMGEGFKVAAAAAHGFNESVDEVTNGLKAERDEALAGVAGHSEFDKTLDKVGGTLMNMRDKLIDATNAHEDETKASKDGADAADKVSESNQGATDSYLDKQAAIKAAAEEAKKLAVIEKQSLKETNDLWIEHNKNISDGAATPFEMQENAIKAWAEKEVSHLNLSDKNWADHYNAIMAVAKDKMDAIGGLWDAMKSKSIEALQEQLKAEQDVYDKMTTSGLHFSQEVLDEQRKKIQDLQDKLHGMGDAGKDAFDKMTEAAKNNTEAMIKAEEEADKARKANQAMGGSFEITRENFAATARGMGIDPGIVETLLKKGYSFQQAILWANHPDWPPPEHPGPRVAGFAEGGIVTVGEHGPERVALPFNSMVLPTGRDFPGNAAPIHVTMYINGSAREVAAEIKKIFTNDQLLRGRIPVN